MTIRIVQKLMNRVAHKVHDLNDDRAVNWNITQFLQLYK